MSEASEPELESTFTEELTHVYNISFDVQIRKFVGNRSGRNIGTTTIQADSVETFKLKLWEYCIQFIKKEVIVEGEEQKVSFAANEPQFADATRFIWIYEKTHRKSRTFADFNPKLLAGWHKKSNNVIHIHEYSTSVFSQALYTKVQADLIKTGERDRAGAASNAQLFELTAELKRKYSRYYKAQDMTWQLWASHVLSTDAHNREQLIANGPPSNILSLFARAAEDSDAAIRTVRQNLSVASTVLRTQSRDMDSLKLIVGQLKNKISGAQAIINDAIEEIKELERRIDTIELSTNDKSELVGSMEKASGCTETVYGQELLESVVDQEDIDHLYF